MLPKKDCSRHAVKKSSLIDISYINIYDTHENNLIPI